ncbi:kynurenine formamidase [Rhodococcus sp. PvR044]|uniref:cyclase family protein n=1 Tax=unclassified Rhodococcus (in: high G+C Gram-positive bacteria) TaxID=192944 RepID=UPI000BCEE0D3|nr:MULTISPECIES: cyclase family protein [unclassified Rhodococcus (in: high G+C Gram-positive bacteria)]MBP1161656.1 kynurenine formamidase [Rhodococcus sp. PvR099]PTR38218.1 kynurenine formamidase [Rhodococcus sp. OK611]SNX93150.1 Kynurenine formamidase [Rhodococcus sp. OK270]
MSVVRRIVDLSHPIDTGMPVYPGDPAARLTPHCTVARDGYNVLRVEMGSQSGTHVDAPVHLRDGDTPIDRMDLSLFVGRGVVFDLRGLAPRQPITAAMIAGPAESVRTGDIALVHTGWDRHYGTDVYYDHPFLGADACALLLERGVRAFCLDAPSVDPSGDEDTDYPAHHLIAKAGGVIAENLCNLELVDFPDPLISILPLKLAGGDGAPVRAVAMELDRP